MNSTSSLPSFERRNWCHDVFLSFRGEDVYRGFLSHLRKEFERKGITSLIDRDTEGSKTIGHELVEVIKGSKILVVLFSKHYALSTWCLDELVVILKCWKDSGQTMFPIFYEVDPCDVRKQSGYFGAVFKKTCVGKKLKDVEKWKLALEEVASIYGFHSDNWDSEAASINYVATYVANKLNKAAPSSDVDGLVGIEGHIKEISSLLSFESNDVKMVGIWGPPGIGKSTIVRALYNKLSNNFTHSGFIKSIRGSCEKTYSDDFALMMHLQELLLSKVLDQEDLRIDCLGGAEQRLKDKRVLVVLDDVDDLKQLQAMACKTQLFGCGSRIIITTNDKGLLKAHGINLIYQVDFPCASDALEIFCLSAFGQNSPSAGYEELAMEVRGLAGNLPLGLSAFGSYLRGMSKEEWLRALPRLKTSLDGNIKKVLRYRYEALCDKDRDLFLHIACFFKGESTSNLVKYLINMGATDGLQVLAEKSLISIDKGARVVMHNLSEQLGIEIFRKINKSHGRRKFLVDSWEICDVPVDNVAYYADLSQGSESVQGMDLNVTAITDELSTDDRSHEGLCEPITTPAPSRRGNRTYDVYMSLCGEYICRGFHSHLLAEFSRKNIYTYSYDDIKRSMPDDIKRSMPIGPELLKVIKGSRISIALMSKNFASSTRCLDELVVILKCREELGQILMVIFYEVDPVDVKKQSGYFGTVFEKTCVGKKVEDVKKWKLALEEVAKIAGYQSSNKYTEADLIEEVATHVANKLLYAPLSNDFCGLVGIQDHVKRIGSLLSFDSNDVRMVGIWGPPGVGKSTLARALYYKFSDIFTHSSFVGSIRGQAKTYRDDHVFLLHLQEQLLSDIFLHKDLKIDHLGVAEERLKDKKVLVVLDDVDDLKQLKAMACKTQWFGCGSRIIITTNDKKLLKAHGINLIYPMDYPCSSNALAIFCQYAFGRKSPSVGYEELAMEVSRLVGNLPLGLRVYGSCLQGKSKQKWREIITRSRRTPLGKLLSGLKFNYEALCDEDKYLFLHIACFFKGKKTSDLVEYLNNMDVTHGLQVLAEKSLISIDKGERLVMNNLLAQLGKEIVRYEYRDEVDDRASEQLYRDALDERSSEQLSDTFTARSPLTCSNTYKYQVFPSFCGADVRKTFLSHLLKEFERKGISSFVDDGIERSKLIGPALLEAVQESRISIVMMSKNYASSTWCLNELVEIMKCREESGKIVETIFYEVDPSDVKKQRGDFGNVFKETCLGKQVEDVEKWKDALEKVAQIAGYDSSRWESEAEMIHEVATDVANKLNNAASSSEAEGLVGVEGHIKKISSLLSFSSNDVRMVGIWGPAGIGKTTIARALFKKFSKNFTHTAFMDSMRGSREKTYSDNYAFKLHLQEQLLSKTLNHKDLKIDDLGVAEERLKDKKVLIVLDDVDDIRQLEAMACKTQWFGCGSRIIITTKDTQILDAHEIKLIYHVDYPFSSEALEILCLSAFRQRSPSVGYEELAKDVIGLAGNLPLGLSVFGSYLRGMSREKWKDALARLKDSLDGNIEKVLRVSYEGLCDKDKDLFLHIACFFKGESTSYVEECLAHSELQVTHGLEVLVAKSLISKTEEQHLVMHNLVEQFGKEIVRKDHKHAPGRRKFLVDGGEICDVLTDNKGSESIVGIDLNINAISDELSIDEKAFDEMTSLQFLRFENPYNFGNNNNILMLPNGLNKLPRKLRVLRWDEFPMRYLPPKFSAMFLINIQMRNSHLEKLWEVALPLKYLKRMDLSHSCNLKEVPNLSKAPELETLILNGCENLVELPAWIQNLKSLTHLKMVGCKKLEVLPTNTNLKSLYHLDLNHCTQLKSFPEISTRIEYLDLEYTGVEKVPTSIRSWPNLVKLSMPGYKSLKMFPADVFDGMEDLDLSDTE